MLLRGKKPSLISKSHKNLYSYKCTINNSHQNHKLHGHQGLTV